MSLVYVYGSGECEQLGLGEDQPMEIKKPRKPSLFDSLPGFPARQIVQISCGGMHTVALASDGSVYTWGCNDEKALGRPGAENVPLKVNLEIPVNGISAGDSHTIAYNTHTNQVFYWGCYRNAQSGKTSSKIEEPTRIAQELFDTKSKTRLKKVCSGSHHTLALTTCGKVFGWGDAESGKIGRMLNTRNKNQQALKIEKVGAKNAKDIFCGNQHSFYINDQNQVFAWGLNNWGQLGVGDRFNTCTPKRVKDLDPIDGDNGKDYVVDIQGGEHHSIARTKDGLVYCWGKNDEGQCGLGDTYGDYRKQKKKEEMEKALKEEEEKKREAEEKAKEPVPEPVAVAPVAPVEGAEVSADAVMAPAEPAPAEKPVEVKKSVKKNKSSASNKEDDLKYIFYFYRPQLIDQLWKLELAEGDDAAKCQKKCTHIAAAGHYNYAVMEGSNEVYSWGMGENYVLGNRDDCNQFTPYLLDPRMFEENPVVQIACGTMHTCALTKESATATMPELDASKFVVEEPVQPPVAKPVAVAEPVEEKPVSPAKVNGDHLDDVKSQESKKRSREEFLESNGNNAEIGSAVKKLKIEDQPPMEPIAEAMNENGEAAE